MKDFRKIQFKGDDSKKLYLLQPKLTDGHISDLLSEELTALSEKMEVARFSLLEQGVASDEITEDYDFKDVENGVIVGVTVRKKTNDERLKDRILETNIWDSKWLGEPMNNDNAIKLAALYYDYHTEMFDLSYTQHVKLENGRARLIQRSALSNNFASKLHKQLQSIYRGYEVDFNRYLNDFGRLHFEQVKRMYEHHHERGDFEFIEGI